MEAIKILNEIDEQIKMSRGYGFIVEVHFNKAYQSRIELAIKELEDLLLLIEDIELAAPYRKLIDDIAEIKNFTKNNKFKAN